MRKATFISCILLTISSFLPSAEGRESRYFSPRRIQEHRLTDFSCYDQLVRIEDGSHFKIPSSDTSILSEWRSGDRLVISPNSSYFSFYTYKIRNTTLGTSVLANLHYGPSIGNRFAKQIDEIDYRNQLVRLTDDSYWSISDSCLDDFYRWSESDYIIIGSSNRFSSTNILINVTLNQYADANLYD